MRSQTLSRLSSAHQVNGGFRSTTAVRLSSAGFSYSAGPQRDAIASPVQRLWVSTTCYVESGRLKSAPPT